MRNEDANVLAGGRDAKPPPVSTGYPEGVAEDLGLRCLVPRRRGLSVCAPQRGRSRPRSSLYQKQESRQAAENYSLPLVFVWEDVLEVTYELTADDLWQYNQYYLQHKAPFRSLLISNSSLIIKLGLGFFGLMLFLSFGISVVALLQHHSPDWVMLLSPIALVLAVPRLLPPSKKRIAKAASQQPGFLREHSVTISPEWLAEKTTVNDTKIAWITLPSLEEDKSHFFFFLSKTVAFIIPKRAFSSPVEAQAFLDRSRRYWQAAKNGTPVTAEDQAVWPPAPRLGA